MIKISYLGDAMFDNSMANTLENYRNKNTKKLDFSELFIHIKDLLKQSDFVLANLETPISNNENDLTNRQWEFCSAYEFAEALKECGVHYVSTANNHCLDRGISGIETTIENLDKIGFYHSGLNLQGKRQKPLIVNLKGIKVGILSYTYGTNAVSNHNYLKFNNRHMVNLLQEQEDALQRFNPWEIYIKHRPHGRVEALKRKIDFKLWPENRGKQWFEKVTYSGYRWRLIKKDLNVLKKENIDLSIAYLHIGGQYNLEPSQYTLRTTQRFLDEGCKIVICNHEHVIHGCTWNPENERFATYALGNVGGGTGNLCEPYDRRSEYSIVVHTYIDEQTKKIIKITFSVLKTILASDNKLEVWPVYDWLYKVDSGNRDDTKRDCLLAAKDFSNVEFNSVEKEFLLWEYMK